MAVDWASVAAEVDAAIKSVGETDEGYPATLRRQVTSGGDPYDPSSGTTTTTYTTLRVIDDRREVRDASGTLVGQSKRTLTAGTGAGVVPTDSDSIAVGIEASQANDNSAWHGIAEVRPLSPAGVAVLYEIDLVTF